MAWKKVFLPSKWSTNLSFNRNLRRRQIRGRNQIFDWVRNHSFYFKTFKTNFKTHLSTSEYAVKRGNNIGRYVFTHNFWE